MAPWRGPRLFDHWAKPAAPLSHGIWRGSRSAGGDQEKRLRKGYVEKVIPITSAQVVHSGGVVPCISEGRRWLRSRGAAYAVASILSWSLLVAPCIRSQQPKPSEYQ